MVVIIIACLVASVYLYLYLTRKRRGLPLPPGPPADPFIGHLRTLPRQNPQDTYHAWGKRYGDVISLSVLGKTIVVLNSEEAAKELLDRRGANYSERPSFALLHAVGWGDVLTFSSYSNREFAKKRSFSQRPFARHRIAAYSDAQEEEVSVLLARLLDHPVSFDRHLYRFSTGILLNILYGRHSTSSDDKLADMADEILQTLDKTLQPSLLDISSIFRRLPGWLPGAWFIRYIHELEPRCKTLMHLPMTILQDQLRSGNAKPSLIATAFDEDCSRSAPIGTDCAQFLCSEGFQMFAVGGALGTTSHSLSIFVLCMMMNPDVQRRGQDEIARVVGNDRLPDFTDRASLPYVECILQESLRWHPVTPTGFPHVSLADDEYAGMFIPAGSIVLANGRAITLDERRYTEPHAFVPERFLPTPEGRGESFSENAVFGWGRRICPGRYLAQSTMWLAIARILATFDICKPVNAASEEFEPVIEFETTLTSHPKPFPCILKPRSAQSIDLIHHTFQLHHPSP